jgi:hypothetical protein
MTSYRQHLISCNILRKNPFNPLINELKSVGCLYNTIVSHRNYLSRDLGLLVGRVLMYKLSKTDTFFSGDLLYFCSHVFQTATLL